MDNDPNLADVETIRLSYTFFPLQGNQGLVQDMHKKG